MATCTQYYYAKDQDGNSLPFTIWFDFYQDGTFYGTLDIRSGKRIAVSHKKGATIKIVATTSVDGWITPEPFEFTACHTKTIVYIKESVPAPPTISSISWSPAGDYETLRSGTALEGDTENLSLVGTDPDCIDGLSAGEAMLQIGEGDPFTVKEYDHIRFDNKEWWVLNIICGPECDFITLADEDAEAKREPKIGDKIEFAAAIDWHDKEVSTIKWYYAKSPDECFEKEDLEWVLFATDTDMPAYAFDDDGDEEITFIKITATNKDGDIGELDTLCGPIFNLWKKPGFNENWLIDEFMAYILPGLAEKFEYLSDLVFDGEAEPTSGGFSLLWSPTEFVEWIAEELAGVAEDILDIVFGTPEEEEAGGFSVLWSPAEFVAWLYKSIAAMMEDILDLVFKED